MEDRVIQYRVGLMVLATLVIGAILIVLFSDPQRWLRGRYEVHVRFADVRGVQRDTPVRKNGILIGRVSDVDFHPQGGAQVTLSIDGNRPLYRHETCRVRTALMGDATLEFVSQPGQPKSDQPIQEGDVIEGSATGDPFAAIANLEDDLEGLIATMDQAGQDISDVSRRVSTLLDENDERLSELLTKSSDMVDSIRSAADSADALLGDPEMRDNLKSTLDLLPDVFADARDLVRGLKGTQAKLDRNLDNLERFTEPLGERSEELLTKLDGTLTKADRLFENLADFSEALNSEEGTLGRLLHDEELYNHLNDAVANVEDMTSDLRPLIRQLRPIVQDVRVVTDKLARDPGQIGLKGVFQRQGGTKWVGP
jgi:phospholipid/cholesterol/gamma-HCH transport system substrate-binding protein